MGILHHCFGGCGSTSRKQFPTTIELLSHRFSLSQLRKSTNDFHHRRIIGEGPYDVVYRASISVNGQLKDIALKRLRPTNSSHHISIFKNEIILMCQLHHPNLVSLVGFCDDQNELIMVYDYVPNGSLFNQLYTKSPALPWKKRLEISIGVARGLHYLHSGTKRTIIHLNTSPKNIILDENWVPKLPFFGLSLKGPKFSEKVVKPIELECAVGTLGYIAPECFSCAPNATHKCDVYSFGALLIELICGNSPHQIMSRHKVSDIKEVLNLKEIGKAEAIIDQSLEGEIAPQCWKLYMDLTESCLSGDPNERPDMGDVEVQLEHVLQLQEEADANHALHAF
ncbi:hypothetical protein K1719_004602 [Acacia pycnantha]|nr:hypothetical protein K1719_004602 [Acacia pycnantha]